MSWWMTVSGSGLLLHLRPANHDSSSGHGVCTGIPEADGEPNTAQGERRGWDELRVWHTRPANTVRARQGGDRVFVTGRRLYGCSSAQKTKKKHTG
ncbi:hypothetical protein LZ30DRAFT_712198, partial [Colletotrichum cereale]